MRCRPKVSITVPVYNCEPFLEHSLKSLLGQTYLDFELIVSDNASTDRTSAICLDYALKDRRIKYFRNETNLGGPKNFGLAFALGTGEYNKWSTADDFWDPTMIEKCVAVLDSEPEVVLCYPKTRLVDVQGKILQDFEDNLDIKDSSPSKRFVHLLESITLCNAHLGVIRSDVLRKTALITSEVGSDIHLLAELALYGKFHLVPEYLFSRRLHEKSSSWDRKNVEHQRGYYDPGHLSTFALQCWRTYSRLFSSVRQSEIAVREKFKLYHYLARRMKWEKGILLSDLIASLKTLHPKA